MPRSDQIGDRLLIDLLTQKEQIAGIGAQLSTQTQLPFLRIIQKALS